MRTRPPRNDPVDAGGVADASPTDGRAVDDDAGNTSVDASTPDAHLLGNSFCSLDAVPFVNAASVRVLANIEQAVRATWNPDFDNIVIGSPSWDEAHSSGRRLAGNVSWERLRARVRCCIRRAPRRRARDSVFASIPAAHLDHEARRGRHTRALRRIIGAREALRICRRYANCVSRAMHRPLFFLLAGMASVACSASSASTLPVTGGDAGVADAGPDAIAQDGAPSTPTETVVGFYGRTERSLRNDSVHVLWAMSWAVWPERRW